MTPVGAESTAQKEQSMSTNPRQAMHQAARAQQDEIERLRRTVATQGLQIAYIANLAGVSQRVAAIQTVADAENPAQPVPNPASEAPFETTEQAVTPETYDDVRNPGMTPGSVNNLAADTTDVALAPGASLPTAPFNDLQNVQAPVAGTETQLPLDQTRIETDVRVGDPMNPQGAFPWTMGPNNSNQVAAAKGDRTFQAIHLARLRLAAGIETGTNDLALGQRIASSTASDADIANEIGILSKVQRQASQSQARPAGLVPRSASTGVVRTTPSLANTGGEMGSLQVVAAASDVASDVADSDLFD